MSYGVTTQTIEQFLSELDEGTIKLDRGFSRVLAKVYGRTKAVIIQQAYHLAKVYTGKVVNGTKFFRHTYDQWADQIDDMGKSTTRKHLTDLRRSGVLNAEKLCRGKTKRNHDLWWDSPHAEPIKEDINAYYLSLTCPKKIQKFKEEVKQEFKVDFEEYEQPSKARNEHFDVLETNKTHSKISISKISADPLDQASPAGDANNVSEIENFDAKKSVFKPISEPVIANQQTTQMFHEPEQESPSSTVRLAPQSLKGIGGFLPPIARSKSTMPAYKPKPVCQPRPVQPKPHTDHQRNTENKKSDRQQVGIPTVETAVPANVDLTENAQKMVDVWNEMVQKDLEGDVVLSEAVKKRLESIYQDNPEKYLQEWKGFCDQIRRCKFLMGEVGNNPFKITVSWAITPSNMVQIQAGFYPSDREVDEFSEPNLPTPESEENKKFKSQEEMVFTLVENNENMVATIGNLGKIKRMACADIPMDSFSMEVSLLEQTIHAPMPQPTPIPPISPQSPIPVQPNPPTPEADQNRKEGSKGQSVLTIVPDEDNEIDSAQAVEKMLSIWDTMVQTDLGGTAFVPASLRKRLETLYYDTFNQDFGKWTKFCDIIRRSNFLMGKTDADFAFSLGKATYPDRIEKILSGTYDQNRKISEAKKPTLAYVSPSEGAYTSIFHVEVLPTDTIHPHEEHLKSQLRSAAGSKEYDRWFRDARILLDPLTDKIIMRAPTRFFRTTWTENQTARFVKEAFKGKCNSIILDSKGDKPIEFHIAEDHLSLEDKELIIEISKTVRNEILCDLQVAMVDEFGSKIFTAWCMGDSSVYFGIKNNVIILKNRNFGYLGPMKARFSAFIDKYLKENNINMTFEITS